MALLARMTTEQLPSSLGRKGAACLQVQLPDAKTAPTLRQIYEHTQKALTHTVFWQGEALVDVDAAKTEHKEVIPKNIQIVLVPWRENWDWYKNDPAVPLTYSNGIFAYLGLEKGTPAIIVLVDIDCVEPSVVKFAGTGKQYLPARQGWTTANLRPDIVEDFYQTKEYSELKKTYGTQPFGNVVQYVPEYERFKRRTFYYRVDQVGDKQDNQIRLCIIERVAPPCATTLVSIDHGIMVNHMFPEHPPCDEISSCAPWPTLKPIEETWRVAGCSRKFTSEKDARNYLHDIVKRYKP
jgi:hypothetical protein